MREGLSSIGCAATCCGVSLELRPGSGGRDPGGASCSRHVRPSRRRLRSRDAISLTGGAASSTRRRRETLHSTTPSIPRCQGGGPRRRAPVGIQTCDHISIRPIRGRRAGTPGTHSTGPDRLRPITVQRSHHSWMANRPRYTRAFKGLGAGSAKHNPRLKLTRAPMGMAGRGDPPGHSCCLGTGPTAHNPHNSRGTPRAAGR